MKHTTLIMVMLVALLGLAACDGGGSDEAVTCLPGEALVDGSCVGPVPNPDPDITCNVDSDCDEGLACLNGECKTSVVPECKSDADCGEDQVCVDGACAESACVPDCAGKTCGDDGCGGNCGSCEDGFICNSAGLCTGGGGDPAEGCDTNADCLAGEACVNGFCEKTACTPNCKGKTCGDDGCGGNCGTCDTNETCNTLIGMCVENSKQECEDNSDCKQGFFCKSGKCVYWFTPAPPPIAPFCIQSCTGKQCGNDGCDGTCGSCNADQSCSLSGSCIDNTPQDNSPVINFPDPILRKEVKKALGIPANQPVTVAACSKLISFTYSNYVFEDVGCKLTPYKIKSLAGLEYCTNLTSIDVACNRIKYTDTLTTLPKLTSLNLGYQNGTTKIDIKPLKNLTGLIWLDLSNNQLTDITPLKDLTELADLTLRTNQINDITPLTGLTKLTRLYLDYNQINNISPLQGLTLLTSLGLTSNQIDNISPLQGLTKLTWLDLDYNQIDDISSLQGLTLLTRLGLSNNKIDDISPLVTNAKKGGLGKGDYVWLSGNPLTSPDVKDDILFLINAGVEIPDLN